MGALQMIIIFIKHLMSRRHFVEGQQRLRIPRGKQQSSFAVTANRWVVYIQLLLASSFVRHPWLAPRKRARAELWRKVARVRQWKGGGCGREGNCPHRQRTIDLRTLRQSKKREDIANYCLLLFVIIPGPKPGTNRNTLWQQFSL